MATIRNRTLNVVRFLACLISGANASAWQDASSSVAKIERPHIRFVRVPFEAVTRAFPPGSDLESLRIDELNGILEPITADARTTSSESAFLGSVDHELAIRDNLLQGVSRFESPGEESARRGFRAIPDWLDGEYLARSRWSAVDGVPLVAPDGGIFLDASKADHVLRWSVPPLDGTGPLRFPVRFPRSIVSRILISLPADSIPSSDTGRWIPVGSTAGSDRRWMHSGPTPPGEIRIENRSKAVGIAPAPFEADSLIEWSVTDDSWTGTWSANLRSAGTIAMLKSKIPAGIVVTGCTVNGTETAVNRAAEEIRVPIESAAGVPVTIRLELKRNGTNPPESEMPTLVPLEGDWFLARAIVTDHRQKPFAGAFDTQGKPLRVTIEPPAAGATGPLKMRFAMDAPSQIVVLRSAIATPTPPALLEGTSLIRRDSAFTFLRVSLNPDNRVRPDSFRIRTRQKPVRIEASRTSTSGLRTNCDFEVRTEEDGFVVRFAPSDPSRGPLVCEMQLSCPIEPERIAEAIPIPTIVWPDGSIARTIWSVLSDDPQIRLRTQTSQNVRWSPIPTGDVRSELPGVPDLGPSARTLVAWTSEFQSNPELFVERIPASTLAETCKSMAILIGDRTIRKIHLLRFEIDPKEPANFRELPPSALTRAIAQRMCVRADLNPDAQEPKVEIADDLPRMPKYRHSVLAAEGLDQELAALLGPDQESRVPILIVRAGTAPLESSIRDSAGIRDRDLDAELARSAIAFLESNRSLSDRFDLNAFSTFSARNLTDFRNVADKAGGYAELFGLESPDVPIVTGDMSLHSEIFDGGSARHRLSVSIPAPIAARLRIVPGPGCTVRAARFGGKPLRFETDDRGNVAGTFLRSDTGGERFELDFETTPESILGNGFPMDLGFLDGPVTWSIRSFDDSWTIEPASTSGSVAIDDRKSGDEAFTSLANLGNYRFVRRGYVPAVSNSLRFLGLLSIWSILTALIIFPARRWQSRPGMRVLVPAITFLTLFLAKSPGFAIASGVIMLSFALSTKRILARNRAAKLASVVLAGVSIVSEIGAQQAGGGKSIEIVIPYAELENAFETPNRAIVAADDLARLRRISDELKAKSSAPRLLVSNARHSIETADEDSIRVESNYAVRSSPGPGTPGRSTATVMELPADDALQVRAFLGGTEAPVRVDRNSGRVEIRFDQTPEGELTIRKTFLKPAASQVSKCTVWPTVNATITQSAERPGFPDTVPVVSTAWRSVGLAAGSTVFVGLAREFELKPEGLRSQKPETRNSDAWFTAVRTFSGTVLSVRLVDPDRTARTWSWVPSMQFLDAADCDAFLMPAEANGKRQVRIVPNQNSVRVRFWIPLASGESELSESIDISPGPQGNRAILRLANSADVAGEWSVLSDSKEFVEDPFELDSAAAEAEATIVNSFEIDDWRTIRWRFVERTGLPVPSVETILTLDETQIFGRHAVALPISRGSMILRNLAVSFAPGTEIVQVRGTDVFDSGPSKDDPNAREIAFAAGPDGIARFELTTRTRIGPSSLADPKSDSAKSTLPWPRFDAAPLPAGILIVQRRIDPESSFRSNPILAGQAPIESLGEIRTSDMPADQRRWLYQFRGGAAAPEVGWQQPGVFSHVQVDHRVELGPRDVRWQCVVRYVPIDGPLSSILLEMVRTDGFEPVIEPDDPAAWSVEKIADAEKIRYRLRANAPRFGPVAIRLRASSEASGTRRFDLPKVSPLGHGRVDKMVSVIFANALDPNRVKIESRGLIDSPPPSSITREGAIARTWKFRSPDAALSLSVDEPGSDSEPKADNAAPEPAAWLNDLAFERTDDGLIYFYATVDARGLLERGLPIPDGGGTVRVFDWDGSEWPIERREGSIHSKTRELGGDSGPLLLIVRIPIERWPDWLRTLTSNSPGRPVVYAIRESENSKAESPGEPARLGEWLGIGRLDAPEDGQPLSWRLQARARRFRLSEEWARVRSVPEIPKGDAAPSTESKVETGRDVGVDRFIDDRLLASPDRWRFYRLVPLSNGSNGDPLAEGAFDPAWIRAKFQRSVIAFSLTAAVMLCLRRRQVTEIVEKDSAK